ncbi:WD40-repeat-containing domain protein [Cokeromyces recurvatus]|uniref:WD40-repeat-containing domain protein n=1 Tax=Cokeromyces recurvatus TaxID=90255 RepID=UPI0022212166|nr:WD40-repeat-containing domain protein [Cokeromyces recurvatus]KAI7903062.1 WD40-repeat-containing domain protein [Cokeromyces recurvatus]
MRDLENPSLATEYVGHKFQTTVARYSPSGYYMTSGDAQGNVRIWDTVNEEHVLKTECRPVTDKVTDIAWDCESKRLIAVGQGKERFGHAFSLDTLSSVGEITGHSKVINAVSIRQQRPFRAVTCSDDMTVSFFTGVPFKHVKTIRDHTRFVHSVQFSPNGDFFVSGGADGKIFLYDGKTGDKLDELVSEDNAHKGSVFALAWSPDSTQLLSSSADYTAKIWDINTKSVVNTFEINSALNKVDNQQVGNLWKNDYLITASLSGELSYLDKNSGKVSRRIDGHSKAITALTVNQENDTFFTGSYDGRAYGWKYGEEGDHTLAKRIEGEGHGNQVTALSLKQDELLSIAMDDTIRLGSSKEFKYSGKAASTGSLPTSLSISDNKTAVIATNESIVVYNDELKKIGELKNPDFTPYVTAISPDSKTVFVGSTQDNKVRIYELNDGNLSLIGELVNNLGNITSLAVHPKLTNLIAVGDSVGKIFIYDLETKEPIIQNWVFHSSRITSMDWSSCGNYLVSGSIDTNIYVWNREKPFKKVAIKNAHVHAVNQVRFLHKAEGLTIISVGQDSAVRVWEVAF